MRTRHQELVRLPHPAGGTLHLGVSYPEAPGEWAVLYVHGLGSTRAGEKARALEEACARWDWTFASFDFRGHGESSGSLMELTGSGLLEDLAAVRDYLVGEGTHRLCLVGSSMGGWAAAWFALRAPQTVPACVLIAPALEFLHSRWRRLSAAEREDWKERGRLRVHNEWIDVELGYPLVEEMDRFPPDRLSAELACPLLIYHGMQDEVIPYPGSVRFVEKACHADMELRLLKDGDHRLSAHKEEIAEGACAFFARRLATR